jgi:hypothetical protein
MELEVLTDCLATCIASLHVSHGNDGGHEE